MIHKLFMINFIRNPEIYNVNYTKKKKNYFIFKFLKYGISNTFFVLFLNFFLDKLSQLEFSVYYHAFIIRIAHSIFGSK